MNYNDPIFLKKIENGETFVKKLPQNIGRLIFFYTTNSDEKPKYSESQYKTQGNFSYSYNEVNTQRDDKAKLLTVI